MTRTLWVQGTRLSPGNAALAAGDPTRDRVLLVESLPHVARGRIHRHKAVLVLAAMRAFAEELRGLGWTVDETRLDGRMGFGDAVAAHVRAHGSTTLVVEEPVGWQAARALPGIAERAGVALDVRPEAHFLCSRGDFAEWAGDRRRLRMQEFYRWMRERHAVLLDDAGGPEGGKWSFDPENRETFAAWRRSGEPLRPPPPGDAGSAVVESVQNDLDRLLPDLPGRRGDFWLPVTRAGAERWLDDFVAHRLAGFGPFEDVADPDDPWLRHATISPLLNLGLLEPMACVRAAEAAHRAGAVPLASAEGFIRQVLGWREYVNGVYWLRMPGYAELNELDARAPVPAALDRGAATGLACVAATAEKVERLAWAHHIERLMIAGNLMLLVGTDPVEANRWFRERFADGYDWVMQANVTGMALHADGGMMATKPYAAGGAYLKRMTGHCRGCRFDPARRTGDDACPFTTLYWDFTARHLGRLRANPRTAQAARGWDRFDADEQAAIRARADEVRRGVLAGTL